MDFMHFEMEPFSPVLCGSVVLKMDEACLFLPSSDFLEYSYSDCESCDYLRISSNSSVSLRSSTPLKLRGNSSCSNTTLFSLQEFGLYSISPNSSCELFLLKAGVNSMTPLFFTLLVLTLLILGFLGVRRSCKSPRIYELLSFCRQDSREFESFESIDSKFEGIFRNLSRRLASLDTFRGLSISLMIFVNYGGGGYRFLSHSPWNGLTMADMVFPSFVFISGVSLSFSIYRQLRDAEKGLTILIKILRRSIVLFFLGILLNAHNESFSSLRIPGVLQRISGAVLVTGLLTTLRMTQNIRSYESLTSTSSSWRKDNDFFEWIFMILLLGVHTSLTFLLDVPGCPKGYLGPGGLHDFGRHSNCTGGSSGYIDRLLLTPKHMASFSTYNSVYHSSVLSDPEGLLGTLTTIFLVFIGTNAGKTILAFSASSQRMTRWIFWSLIFGVLGGVLCGFSTNGDGIIPINKNLWSLSFVFLNASFSLLLMTLLYYWIDVRRWWNGNPFRIVGYNPILLYVAHEVFQPYLLFNWKPFTNTHIELLLMNIWGTFLWILFAIYCYKKNFFISL